MNTLYINLSIYAYFLKDENGEVGNFFPNTDFTFGEMRQQILKEWANRLH